jgi:hypothetical protein
MQPRTKANWIFNTTGAVMIASLAGTIGIPLMVPHTPNVLWKIFQIAFIVNLIVWIIFTWMLFSFRKAEGWYETITATILATMWMVNGCILAPSLIGLVAMLLDACTVHH